MRIEKESHAYIKIAHSYLQFHKFSGGLVTHNSVSTLTRNEYKSLASKSTTSNILNNLFCGQLNSL